MNEVDKNKLTLLHIAVAQGIVLDFSCVGLIVKCGQSFFVMTISIGHEKATELLLLAGDNDYVNRADRWGLHLHYLNFETLELNLISCFVYKQGTFHCILLWIWEKVRQFLRFYITMVRMLIKPTMKMRVHCTWVCIQVNEIVLNQ